LLRILLRLIRPLLSNKVRPSVNNRVVFSASKKMNLLNFLGTWMESLKAVSDLNWKNITRSEMENVFSLKSLLCFENFNLCKLKLYLPDAMTSLCQALYSLHSGVRRV